MKSCTRCYAVVTKLFDSSIFMNGEKADKNSICWRCADEFNKNPIYKVINIWEQKK